MSAYDSTFATSGDSASVSEISRSAAIPAESSACNPAATSTAYLAKRDPNRVSRAWSTHAAGLSSAERPSTRSSVAAFGARGAKASATTTHAAITHLRRCTSQVAMSPPARPGGAAVMRGRRRAARCGGSGERCSRAPRVRPRRSRVEHDRASVIPGRETRALESIPKVESRSCAPIRRMTYARRSFALPASRDGLPAASLAPSAAAPGITPSGGCR